MNLPLYECHKQVRAAKVNGVAYLESGDAIVDLDAPEPILVRVSMSWLSRNNIEPGGYYVEYADGYTSYSPAKAFEEGYALLPDADETKQAIAAAGGPEDISLGQNSTPVCLRVTRSDGTLLLELDEHGRIHWRRHSIEVENRVPERIVAAAAGGIDFTDLPKELKTVMLADVELVDFGKSLVEGDWLKLRVLDEDHCHDMWAMDPKEMSSRLMHEQSTLRCIIFEADQVHREEEPEPDEDYAMQAQALMQSGWFARPDVRSAMVSFDQNIAMPRSSAEACHQLVHSVGYHQLQETPPQAIYLWAVDHGVVDGLPDCYRGVADE